MSSFGGFVLFCFLMSHIYPTQNREVRIPENFHFIRQELTLCKQKTEAPTGLSEHFAILH